MYFQKMNLHSIEAQGNEFLFTHLQDVVPVMAMAADARENTDNGWTTTRNMQMIGDIPDVVFFNHPEFYNDDKALRRWLNSDEGRPYRVARFREDRGIRVK